MPSLQAEEGAWHSLPQSLQGEPALGHLDREPLASRTVRAAQSVVLCSSSYDNDAGTWGSQLPLSLCPRPYTG